MKNNESKKTVVIFLDKILPKNYFQLDYLENKGYSTVLFLNEIKNEIKNINQHELIMNFWGRLNQIYSFLKLHKKKIHHVEIYPGGRFSFIYFILAKMWGVKTICAERGDILYYRPKSKGGFSFLTRCSMYICYKLADIVWYREPYMLEKLLKFGIKKNFFLHNTISTKATSRPTTFLYDFLWVNRVIPERRADWFVDNLKELRFNNSNNVLLGLLNKESLFIENEKYVLENKLPNLTLLPYQSPTEYYINSKFFVLPATIVFANNSLLEAMSYGIVPLVSNTISSNLIITDGLDGFIFDHNKDSFLKAMTKAINLTDIEYNEMSKKVKEKISNEFSMNYYYKSLDQLYEIELFS